MWSENDRRTRGNTFDHNTVQTPTLANGIAIYGGTDNTVSDNLSPTRSARAARIQVGSRFGAEPFAGHAVDHRQHHGPRRHVRAELEHRPRRHLVLRAREEHRRGHPGGRRPLPRQHLQRDHAGRRLAGEGPVLDHRTSTSRTSGSTAPAPRCSAPGRPGRRSFENVDARNVGAVGVNNCGSFHFTAGRLGVLARPTSAATTAAAPPARGSPRGSCRTPSPATTARRSSCRRRRRPGDGSSVKTQH